MIKGRYVALVEIDLAYEEENHPDVIPFGQMKSVIMTNGLAKRIKELIQDEIGELGTVTITKQYADLYQWMDEEECNNG